MRTSGAPNVFAASLARKAALCSAQTLPKIWACAAHESMMHERVHIVCRALNDPGGNTCVLLRPAASRLAFNRTSSMLWYALWSKMYEDESIIVSSSGCVSPIMDLICVSSSSVKMWSDCYGGHHCTELLWRLQSRCKRGTPPTWRQRST